MTESFIARSRTLVFLGFMLCVASAQAAIPSGMLEGKSPSLHPMLEKVLPSVVNVVVTGKAQQTPQNPLFNDPFFRRFFSPPGDQGQDRGKGNQQPQMEQPTATGSGVIVNAAKGLIVTNNHVVENAEKIVVRLNDNREFTAKRVGTDPQTDVAVIQIKADKLTQIPIADSDKLQVGDFVVAIGNPFGLRQTVTSGIVSGLGRHNPGLGSRYQNFIQTDASINPGNSGGALVNLKGRLVGINSEILSQSGGNIGIGFAIPSNLAQSVYRQLVQYGKVKRGQLGVVGQNLTPDLAKAFGLQTTQGVVVAQVMPKSPAAKAGIRERDVITAVNDKPIEDFSDLAQAIGLRAPGDKVTITLIRDGKQQQIKATLADAAATASTNGAGAGNKLAKGLQGATFGALTDDNPMSDQVRNGVVVTQVERGSPAAQAGLRPDDVITSINQQQLTSVAQLYRLAGPKTQRLLLHVRRGAGAMFILIQ